MNRRWFPLGLVSNNALVRRRQGCPAPSARCSELVADVTLFRRNKSPKIYQQIPSTVPRQVLCDSCCPHDHNLRLFSVPTRWRSRSHKPLCGALRRKAGATMLRGSTQNPGNFSGAWLLVSRPPKSSQLWLWPCSSEKKRRGSGTDLPTVDLALRQPRERRI